MENGMQALSPTIPMGLFVVTPAQPPAPRVPTHLALVLQGHRLWALRRGLPHTEVLAAAASRLLELIDFCATRSLQKVTIHLFADDMCRFPAEEHAELVRTFTRYAWAGAHNMHRNGVCMRIEGSLNGLDGMTRGLLRDTAQRTQQNRGMQLTLVIDDPGERQDHQGGAEAIVLRTEPDFVIRTGGPLPEHRAMLWDTTKTALYFTDALWPAFDARDLRAALDWYGHRERSAGIQLNTLTFPTLQQS